jgi:hypothetical protein
VQEHHWTDYGEGTELALEQATYLRAKLWEYQPAEYLPDSVLSANLISAAYEVSYDEVVKHPVKLSFGSGLLLGGVAVAAMAYIRRCLFSMRSGRLVRKIRNLF